LLLTPLTRAAYEFGQAVAASGSLATGWQVVGEARWLRWGKVYHLWFLASLLLFSAGAIGLEKIARALPAAARTRLDEIARAVAVGPARMPLLIAAVAALMVPSWSWGTGQGTDGWMQLAIFGFFVLGWLLYRYRDALAGFTRKWWHGPALALAVMPLCAWASIRRLHAEGTVDLAIGAIAGVTNAIVAVGMTLGLLGIFQLRFAERGRLGQYASEASYWIYLIHYPVVIAAGGVMAAAAWPAMVKYLATVAISLPIIIGSYELLVRHSPLGAVLGGRPAREPLRQGNT
jgi:peptidoglycan/LPS O-acetylase OafA/YrhL